MEERVRVLNEGVMKERGMKIKIFCDRESCDDSNFRYI
jgi:hypothetical protein